MCSFGQDALDSLYLSTVHKKKRRVLVHFLIVCITACLHSLLLFVHVTTLTVAVNSSDQVHMRGVFVTLQQPCRCAYRACLLYSSSALRVLCKHVDLVDGGGCAATIIFLAIFTFIFLWPFFFFFLAVRPVSRLPRFQQLFVFL